VRLDALYLLRECGEGEEYASSTCISKVRLWRCAPIFRLDYLKRYVGLLLLQIKRWGMSKFLTELQVELVDDISNEGRGTWRLTAPLIYSSDIIHSAIYIPKGFETDFASVPRLPVMFMMEGDTCHMASALHDYLYTVHMTSRVTADAILKEASLATGVPAWRAWSMWAGVRLFGQAHW
jgi:Protein of unknown function (DUF1353)